VVIGSAVFKLVDKSRTKSSYLAPIGLKEVDQTARSASADLYRLGSAFERDCQPA
jgi:hypothetical protein